MYQAWPRPNRRNEQTQQPAQYQPTADDDEGDTQAIGCQRWRFWMPTGVSSNPKSRVNGPLENPSQTRRSKLRGNLDQPGFQCLEDVAGWTKARNPSRI